MFFFQGMALHSGQYLELTKEFCQNDILVMALDQRGRRKSISVTWEAGPRLKAWVMTFWGMKEDNRAPKYSSPGLTESSTDKKAFDWQ